MCVLVGEVGEWQEVAGGENMVIVGVKELRPVWVRGAQSKDDGRSMLQGVLSKEERGGRSAPSCCLTFVLWQLCAGCYSECAAHCDGAIVAGMQSLMSSEAIAIGCKTIATR